jgi:uncharacterized protein YbjT (DUF2867 family)
MRIAVAGGTGLVGRLVVDAVAREGHEPVVLARSTGVDLTGGDGLEKDLSGVSRLIDVTNIGTTKRSEAVAFFETVTRHLLAAGARAGVEHHVALSIVGVDRVNIGYYAGKLRQEELALSGAVPVSVLRATQFHEFAAQLVDRASLGPAVLVPSMLSQPIAAAEVADALVERALGQPVGMAAELAGPEPLHMRVMVRRLLQARGSRRVVVPLYLPIGAARAMATGGLLPLTEGPRGRQTYAEWLRQAEPAQAG